MLWKWLSKIRKNEHPDFRLFRSTIDNIEAQTKKVVVGLDHRDNYQEIDGKLNGRIKIEDLWMPIISGQLITEIDNNRISGCSNINNVDGKINGCIAFGNMQLPVINNEIIGKVDGLTIDDCHNISNIDGTLNGAVRIKGKWLPVLKGELITMIEGCEIIDCAEIHVINNTLSGRVKFANYPQEDNIIENNINLWEILPRETKEFIPMINGRIISLITYYGKEVQVLDCSCIHNIGGKINGKIKCLGLNAKWIHWVPIISNMIHDIVDPSLEISDCDEIRNINGQLNGWVEVWNPHLYSLDKFSLPIISSNLITSLEDKIILESREVRNIENTLNGRIMYNQGGHTWWPVIANKLISCIEDKKINNCANIHNIANTLNGEVGLGEESLGERRHYVVLGEVVK